MSLTFLIFIFFQYFYYYFIIHHPDLFKFINYDIKNLINYEKLLFFFKIFINFDPIKIFNLMKFLFLIYLH